MKLKMSSLLVVGLGAVLASPAEAWDHHRHGQLRTRATNGDVLLHREIAGELAFTDGEERVPAELAELRASGCMPGAEFAVVVPSRDLKARTEYRVVTAGGAPTRVAAFVTAEGPQARPAWTAAPRLAAESVVDGVRRVVIAVPQAADDDTLIATLVCPDGTVKLSEERPVHHGVAVVAVSSCDGRDAAEAILRLESGAVKSMPARLAIPPLGAIRSAAAVAPATYVCAPSLLSRLVTFGVLPFVLSYLLVSLVRRRRRR